jgi:hypothetical protein
MKYNLIKDVCIRPETSVSKLHEVTDGIFNTCFTLNFRLTRKVKSVLTGRTVTTRNPKRIRHSVPAGGRHVGQDRHWSGTSRKRNEINQSLVGPTGRQRTQGW